MATVKKTAASTAAEEAKSDEVVQNTVEEKKAPDTANNTVNEGNEEYTAFAYIGPPFPNATLKTNAILQGSRAEIEEFYKEIIEEYPQVKRLIVPVHKLGEMARKTRVPGNLIHKYYTDIASAISGGSKEE